jgi:hypothetical protein
VGGHYRNPLNDGVFRGRKSAPVSHDHDSEQKRRVRLYGSEPRSRLEGGIAKTCVTAIDLAVAKPVLRTIAEPPEAKALPASGYHAGVQRPYTVAALQRGVSRTPSPPSCV